MVKYSEFHKLCYSSFPLSSNTQAVKSALVDNESLAAAIQSDRLLGGFGAAELKILLDIVMENQRAEGFTASEICAGIGAFTQQACSSLVILWHSHSYPAGLAAKFLLEYIGWFRQLLLARWVGCNSAARLMHEHKA